MRRWRLACPVVVLALAAAACNGSTSADPSPSRSPTSAAASPTPSPTPAPSPSPTEVLPANDVDDPVAALEAIVAYRDHLFENPDPDKLKLIYAERCECYEPIHRALVDARDKNQRLEFMSPRSLEVLEVERQEGPFAQIRYAVNEPPARSLNDDGSVDEESRGTSSKTELTALLVKEGGRWLVVGLV